MTLILPQFNKNSIFNKSKMNSIEEIVAYLENLDKDIQRLTVALRPDKIVDLTDAATIETDAALAIHFRVNLTAAIGSTRVLGNPTNGRDGQKVIWEFVQSSTGSNAVTLDTKWSLSDDIPAFTLTTTANGIDMMGATYDAPNDKWRILALNHGYTT